VILISTDNNWLITVLNAFRWSITETPSLILRRYNFFQRNNLFTRDFDSYKIPNLSQSFFVDYLPETFNNIESPI
jgi:hypothetical protein